MELTVQKLTKKYKGKNVVSDVILVLTHGVYGLLDANGAGKATLMRMISGAACHDLYMKCM